MLIPSGSKCIDKLLGGGVETGTVTQIYGESGTGKTTLCLMLCKNAAKLAKAVYIDTEGLSGERVTQIFGEDEKLLNNVFIHDVYEFRQQGTVIKKLSRLCKSEKIRLAVVDSFTGLYRSELEDSIVIRVKRELTKQLTFLLGIARKYDVAVVITNQMFSDVNTGKVLPLGGTSVNHLSKVILELKKTNSECKFGTKRMATLIKHRWLAEGCFCEYCLTDKGIEP